ncbi:hypothetical protein SAMD00019534_081340 [Acytostelium subglobosum LB1]|uniref:hypothetical protein n=1 Tax=Acytostelium subglobosum LB1 TaxID=1410327 RepID=UPI000644D1EB|nr:hypothetical protein SAMD00019534_081340 [Acytostelium subglobosum LB1]GAM24959.1 hypothetical protein SAMD00019534_081340 [Acytostelium subglobosum LB1]|eukprot:XP_012752048.1 hypothetical protein SAMD00019534_081340 [Acytostelium subglobosum LB1]
MLQGCNSFVTRSTWLHKVSNLTLRPSSSIFTMSHPLLMNYNSNNSSGNRSVGGSQSWSGHQQHRHSGNMFNNNARHDEHRPIFQRPPQHRQPLTFNNNRNETHQQRQQDSGDGGFSDVIDGRGRTSSNNNGNDFTVMAKVDWSLETLDPINKTTYKQSDKVSAMSDDQVKGFLSEHGISVSVNAQSPTPNPVLEFDDMGFPVAINRLLKEKYDKPTPIQSLGWPIAMNGHDLIGVSQTGSGKTISFVLPAIQHSLSQPRSQHYKGPQVLVIAPTRELSVQISQEAQPYLRAARMNSAVVYGGDSKQFQIQQLRQRPQVIIGTPGRIIDLVQDGHLNLKHVSYFVVDEADRMMDMGFEDQVRAIFANTRPDRQVLYWTATWPQKVKSLAYEFLTDPVEVRVGSAELTANPNIKQMFKIVDTDKDKLNALIDTLEGIYSARPESKVLIFTMTKGGADKLSDHIKKIGNARIEAIHGDKAQNRRMAIINAFKENYIDILVATDVASRGLDIRTITDVINYSLPNHIEPYIHRIGRTARAGATGYSHSIVSRSSHSDISMISDIVEVLQRANQEIPAELHALIPPRCNQNHHQQQGYHRGSGYGHQGRRYGGNNNNSYQYRPDQRQRGPISFKSSSSSSSN